MRSDAIFFASPPADIGRLLSAETSWLTQEPRQRWSTRIAIVFAYMAPALFLMFYGLLDKGPLYTWAGVFCTVMFGLVATKHFKFVQIACSFVGTNGAARYVFRGPHKSFLEQKILFPAASDLRTSLTRIYTNGGYRGTKYSFTWTDPLGRTVFRFKGMHKGKEGLPEIRDPFYFGLAAENAWNDWLLEIAADAFVRDGKLQFAINSSKSIHLSPGFIEFHFKKRPDPDRYPAADIESIELRDGMIRVHHRATERVSAHEITAFPYERISNARFFLKSLERLLQLRIRQ